MYTNSSARVWLVLLAALVASSSGTAFAARANAKPNIVLLLIDDWAWNGSPLPMDDRMANSRMPVLQVPNLERLGREGIRFRNAFSGALNRCMVTSSGIGKAKFEFPWSLEAPVSRLALYPTLIANPGFPQPAMVQNIDYAPTLLEAAGIRIPPEVQGESLVPLLRGNSPANWRKSILYTYYGRGAHAVASHRGVRNDRYKLIHFHTKDEWEFFDLEKDPLEMKSEYDNPKHAEIINGMKRELNRLMAEVELDPESADSV